MNRQERLSRLRQRLSARRAEVFESHRRNEDARRTLQEPEVEFEEMAQNESMADILARLDEQEKAEIEGISDALTKMEMGDYGLCEVCGRRIAVGRLEAIPWTPRCGRCAREGRTAEEAGKRRTESAESGGGLPEEYEGLSGEELGERIADEVRQDEGVDLEELRIAIRDGVLHLEGTLPDKDQHGRLMEIITDHFGITNFMDEILISPLPWEREDRAPGRKAPLEVIEELEAEETETGSGPIASRKAGTPLSPADILVPEEG